MSMTVTLLALAACLVLFAVANLLSRRPTKPGQPGLVPWTAVQFIAALGVILMLAHLVSLMTGIPFAGRLG